VDCSRDKLLANPGFSEYQHVRWRHGYCFDLCQHMFERETFAYNATEVH
jgi:hypothetical protein